METRIKAKLPKGYSYPTNARAIDKALHGLSQLENLVLYFCLEDRWPGAAWRTNIEAHSWVRVIELSHDAISRKWTLRINAVPSSDAEDARSSIQNFGLIALHEFFQGLPNPDGRMAPTHLNWRASYHFQTGELRFQSGRSDHMTATPT